LKFASKKEVRDRLKEFDAPDLANYIDPDTIDKINAAKKPPLHLKNKTANNANKKVKDPNVLEENKARIQKMKELYGLFVKMEKGKGEDGEAEDNTMEVERNK